MKCLFPWKIYLRRHCKHCNVHLAKISWPVRMFGWHDRGDEPWMMRLHPNPHVTFEFDKTNVTYFLTWPHLPRYVTACETRMSPLVARQWNLWWIVQAFDRATNICQCAGWPAVAGGVIGSESLEHMTADQRDRTHAHAHIKWNAFGGRGSANINVCKMKQAFKTESCHNRIVLMGLLTVCMWIYMLFKTILHLRAFSRPLEWKKKKKESISSGVRVRACHALCARLVLKDD